MELQANHLLLITGIISLIELGRSMECYVCENQDDNSGKCLKTIKTCEPDEDMCLSEIKWGTQPYWSQGAKKQYYISKRCATKSLCERTKRSYMLTCTHLWYQDWKCSECCAGDKCNYYVITGCSAVKANVLVTIAAAAMVLFASVCLKL